MSPERVRPPMSRHASHCRYLSDPRQSSDRPACRLTRRQERQARSGRKTSDPVLPGARAPKVARLLRVTGRPAQQMRVRGKKRDTLLHEHLGTAGFVELFQHVGETRVDQGQKRVPGEHLDELPVGLFHRAGSREAQAQVEVPERMTRRDADNMRKVSASRPEVASQAVHTARIQLRQKRARVLFDGSPQVVSGCVQIAPDLTEDAGEG